jgi:hypothetical protein
MLGTPNQGAEIADRLHQWKPYQVLLGRPGQELISGEGSLVEGLPKPAVEFAIVAGGFGDDDGVNPWVTGDDDGTVGVRSTRLPGAHDYLIVPKVLHHNLLGDRRVVLATLRFVREGHLRADGRRQPIPETTGKAS